MTDREHQRRETNKELKAVATITHALEDFEDVEEMARIVATVLIYLNLSHMVAEETNVTNGDY